MQYAINIFITPQHKVKIAGILTLFITTFKFVNGQIHEIKKCGKIVTNDKIARYFESCPGVHKSKNSGDNAIKTAITEQPNIPTILCAFEICFNNPSISFCAYLYVISG